MSTTQVRDYQQEAQAEREAAAASKVLDDEAAQVTSLPISPHLSPSLPISLPTSPATRSRSRRCARR